MCIWEVSFLPPPPPTPHPTQVFQIVARNVTEITWKTWTNQANLIPKQWKMRAKRRRNRTKPKKSPLQSCGAKCRILAALGVTWGRLGRSFAPLGVALVDFLLLLGSLWTPFFDVGGFWMGLEAQPMHFWSIFGAILHQKTLKKQCQNKSYSEFEKPWFLRHVCSKNVILEVVRASKIKNKSLKIHEQSRFKQVL